MMHVIGFDREEDAELWARQKLDITATPSFFRAMSAVDDNGDFICVVVFNNFSMRNIDLSIVMEKKKVTPRGIIRMFNDVFGYVFNTLKAARVTGLLRGKNEEAKRINEHFGFKLEGVMRKAFDNDDLHIYGFLAEDYRSHAWYRG
jgi:RimJ/RimL family protein N-acetyltransferase